MASYQDSINESLKYFKQDELAASVFVGKYALTDDKGDIKEPTPDQMHRRIAKEFARIEKKYPNPMSEDEIYELMKDFKYVVPQGSPMNAVGNDYQVQSTSNCFVIEPCYDSYGGILKTDQEQVQLMKRRGGVGHDVSNIRPKGLHTNNAAKTTDGIGVFLERFSNSCREVAQGGRRGALMLTISIHHPEIETFINIKKDKSKVTGANISIRLSDEFMNAVKNDEEYEQKFPVNSENPIIIKKVKAKHIWNQIIDAAWESAEPGLLYWDTATRLTPSDIYKMYGFESTATNPCFAKDTLIAVADGRNYVSIGELAKEGKDVPVYSYNTETGKVSIKIGRHPRLTGTNRQLIRIHLDDSSYLDVTPDHKINLLNGEQKLAKDLNCGDSLPRFVKELDKVKEEGNDYYRLHLDVLNQNKDKIFEHRVIAKFNYENEWNELYNSLKKNGFANTGGLVVHHKDYNPLNNNPENLQIMTWADHIKLHGEKDNNGEMNGRFSGISNEEMVQHAIILTKTLNRRFSNKDWQTYARENKIPMQFSKWRIDNLGTIQEMAKRVAIELGFENTNEDPRLVKTLENMIEQNYISKIEDGVVFVQKDCEICKEKFWIQHLRREQSFCTKNCSLEYVNNADEFAYRRLKGIHKHFKESQKEVTNDQLKIYSDLKFKLNREPFYKEWMSECKTNKIPYRVGQILQNGFKTYKELKEAGNNYNHKVVKIEEIQNADVYNITVDDNHTIGIITKINQKNGKEWFTGVFTPQCGEIILSNYDSCRLMVINLYSFVKNKFKKNSKFDYSLFGDVVYKAQRLMDDLIDIELEQIEKILKKIEDDPQPEFVKLPEKHLWLKIKTACQSGRRTGLGPTALGDTLAALGEIYGSDESIKMTEEIYKQLSLNAYRSSINLAKERGAFSCWSYDLEKDHSFIKKIIDNLDEDTQKMYKKYGRRNIAITTTAPTGSVSVLTQTTSGIEPAYLLYYTRRKKINPNDKDAKVDFTDHLGDKWQEYKVYHHKLKEWMEITGETDIEKSPYHKATSNDVDWISSVKLQAAAQKWVCHAISKTCNLPNSATKELVSDVYMKAWEEGCKGFTVYRDGCRTGVLVSNEEKKVENTFQDHPAPKRPKKLECDINQVTIKGESWTIFVGKYENKPYEIFGGLSKYVHIPKKIKTGFLVKDKKKQNGSSIYDLLYGEAEDETKIHDIVSVFENPTEGAFTRTISLALRHGAPIQYIFEQLNKDDKDSDMYSFSRVISRVLKFYILEGTKASDRKCENCEAENSIIYKEGCKTCIQCGLGKC